MIGIGTRLVVLVASQAREHRKIGRIRMALGARRPFPTVVATVNREVLAVVIESRCSPRGRIVACLASRREFGSGMCRIGR